MIKEALEYIVNLSEPETFHIGGQTYCDKKLNRVSFNPKAEPITMNTLPSLLDYIKSGYDSFGKMFIHIVSPTEVRLVSSLDDERERENLVTVKAKVPSFQFNDYVSHEEFCIALQAKFLNSEDRALLLKFAGTVEAGTVAQYGDDGITQKATIKQGVAGKQDALVPNPVLLKAYRTFVEVDQPEAQYVFRMKQGSNGGVMCALFEADGGAWMIDAKESIREYLAENLEGIENIMILS